MRIVLFIEVVVTDVVLSVVLTDRYRDTGAPI